MNGGVSGPMLLARRVLRFARRVVAAFLRNRGILLAGGVGYNSLLSIRFILFIGPISSIFDYLTLFMMLYVFNCWHNPALLQTGWFVESLFTQTLIIHVIRTDKIPFLQSWASWPLILTSIVIVAVGAGLTVSPCSWAIILVCYVVLTELVKTWFYRRFGE